MWNNDAVKELKASQTELSTLETRLRGIKTVFHTITNVIWVRSKRKTPTHSDNSSPPPHEAQVKQQYIGENPSVELVVLCMLIKDKRLHRI